jgi:hypothetical protein
MTSPSSMFSSAGVCVSLNLLPSNIKHNLFFSSPLCKQFVPISFFSRVVLFIVQSNGLLSSPFAGNCQGKLQARDRPSPRCSEPPCSFSPDAIAAKIKVSQLCTLPQHSSKTLFPGISGIADKIEVGQRSALPQHSCKTFSPVWSDLIVAEIEVSQRCALPQHSCKPLCPRWPEILIP